MKLHTKKAVVIILLSSIVLLESLISHASGGVVIWTQAREGLEGGDISAVVTSPAKPNIFFAILEDGLFKSDNRGGQWKFVHQLPSPRCLSIDPHSPNTLYVGTFFDGVIKSVDGGMSWQSVNTGLNENKILAIAIAPSDSTQIYVATSTESKVNIYRSVDGGEHWQLQGQPTDWMHGILIDTYNPAILYLDTPYGVLKSVDAGRTWKAMNEGMTFDEYGFNSLTIDAAHPSKLYAGTDTGIYKSENGAQSWQKLDFPAGMIFEVAVDPYRGEALFAAGFVKENDEWRWKVFKSENGGADWRQIDVPEHTYLHGFTFDSQFPNIVYALNTSGIGVRGFYRSFNGGETWWPSNQGMLRIDIRSLAVDPQNPQNIFAGGSYRNYGLYKSENGGHQWTLTLSHSISAIAIDYQHPNTVYAGTLCNGVKKSTDGGKTWESKNNGLEKRACIHHLVISDKNPSLLYATTGDYATKLIKSTDGGESWSILAFPECNTITSMNRREDAINAVSKTSHGILGGPGGLCIGSILVAPTTSETVFVNAYNHLYKSVDGGNSWTTADTGINFPGGGAIIAVSIDPHDDHIMWAVGGDSSERWYLFSSVNGGDSWQTVNDNLPMKWIRQLVIDPTNTTKIYLSTWDEGVFISEDGGITWRAVDNGLTSLSVNVLAVNPHDPTVLYAGTEEQGFFVGHWMDYAHQTNLPFFLPSH